MLACHPRNANSRPQGRLFDGFVECLRSRRGVSARHGRAAPGSVGAGHNVGRLESAGGPWDRASTTSAHVPLRRLARVAGIRG